jgi:UDP-glucose 4-epimerase
VKVVIVGPGGFLGRALRREVERGSGEAIGLSSSSEGGIDPARGVFATAPFIPAGADAVFFLAQSPHGRELPQRADHLMSVNAVAPLQAALAARAAGVRRFLYISTGNVYQPGFLPHPEDGPVRRDNWYSLSKVHGEECLALLQDSIHVTIVRLFGLYGPGQGDRLVPRLVDAVLTGREIVLEPRADERGETGGLRLSLCHVADAARILLALVPLNHLRCVNVASDEILSIRGIAEAVARAAGKRAELRAASAPRAFDLVADTSRLRGELAPRFRDFESGVGEMVAHVLQLKVAPAGARS